MSCQHNYKNGVIISNLINTHLYIHYHSSRAYFLLYYSNVQCLHYLLLLICLLGLIMQQLMRERQQMASRPFASVAVALDASGEQMDLMQATIDVSPPGFPSHTCTNTHTCSYHICKC